MSRARTASLPTETLLFGAASCLAILILGPLSLPIPFALQVGLLGAAVIVLGLPHGALDSWIAARAGLYRRPLGWIGFNLAYVLLALAVVVFWWLSPLLALSLFLLISAWHFAADWRATLPLWQRLSAGLALLGMPAVFHPEAVAGIFMTLSGGEAAALAEGLRIIGLAALAALVPVLLLTAHRRQYAALIELALLPVLAAAAPPLLYFTLYFCLLHSPRHLRATLELAPRRERRSLIRSLIAQASLYTLASLVLAALAAAIFLPAGSLSEQALRLVFIGLAALTVPHMLLMLWTERTAPEALDAMHRPAS